MTSYKVKKSTLHGAIAIPASKSHTLRAIIFGAMGWGKTVIHNPLQSPDAAAMIDAMRLMGATIDIVEERIEIEGLQGQIEGTEDVIDSGNSGIVLRLCSALGALASKPVVVTGDASIRHRRPMRPLIEALGQLGVSVKSMRGDYFAPVIIEGPLRGGHATLSGIDSQPVSALLIASAFIDGPTEIAVQEPGEKPWVGLTLDWFDRLGIRYVHHNFEKYIIPGRSHYSGFEYGVPGDFSSAAFAIAAALVTGSELMLKNIDMKDAQGDKELISIFQKMGADITIDEKNNTLIVKGGAKLTGISCDINNFIDAITILAVVACFAEGETIIYNAEIARHKECDRIHSIATELKKMGADITEQSDGLIIRKSTLRGANLHSYNDHRMAMSLAVAGIGADGETTICDVECVAKTFGDFANDFRAMGAKLEEVPHGK